MATMSAEVKERHWAKKRDAAPMVQCACGCDADKALCEAGRELARLAAVAGVQDQFMAGVVAANEAVEKWKKEQPK